MTRISLEEVAHRYASITPAERLTRWKRINSYRAILIPMDWDFVVHVIRTQDYFEAVRQAERILKSQDLTIDNPEEIP